MRYAVLESVAAATTITMIPAARAIEPALAAIQGALRPVRSCAIDGRRGKRDDAEAADNDRVAGVEELCGQAADRARRRARRSTTTTGRRGRRGRRGGGRPPGRSGARPSARKPERSTTGSGMQVRADEPRSRSGRAGRGTAGAAGSQPDLDERGRDEHAEADAGGGRDAVRQCDAGRDHAAGAGRAAPRSPR